jgi:hypothetical protein
MNKIKTILITIALSFLGFLFIAWKFLAFINRPASVLEPSEALLSLEKKVNTLETKKDQAQKDLIIKKIKKQSTTLEEDLNEKTHTELIDMYNSLRNN